MSNSSNSNPKMTPMMEQFLSIKEQYPDGILFFRMGDFYEMFGEDAKIASKVLGITLTSRNKQSENQLPMCGVPYHAYRQYMLKLIKAGYKVAICEQLENPAEAKGLVSRGVTRVVSAGTIIDSEEIIDAGNNFLLAIYIHSDGVCYLCAADISTGEVYLTKSEAHDIYRHIAAFEPKEILSSTVLQMDDGLQATVVPPDTIKGAISKVTSLYKVSKLDMLGLEAGEFAVPFAMVLDYIQSSMLQISFARPAVLADKNRLVLDNIAVKTLELTESAHPGGGTLFSILDYTATPMGARLLKWWILHPLRDLQEINRRQHIINILVNNWEFTQELSTLLKGVYDMERIINRISSGRATARELVWLKHSLAELPCVGDMLESSGDAMLAALGALFHECVPIERLIVNAIVDEPPVSLKDGGLIRAGYNKLVDEYRDTKDNGARLLAELEGKLKAESGINQLKVSYNKVFGYYIEVSKANAGKVPATFERMQTLVNAERYITQELKELQNMILTAAERLEGLEYELFVSIRAMLAESTELLRTVSKNIAEVDLYLSLARAAVLRSYIRPNMDDSDIISVTDGRHPVVEASSKELFISNDVELDSNNLHIITGPNMSGKSTYIRSVALITLMAHMGSFVPAKEARIGLVDRIFTRVGASDNITRGESTFMVEMKETANILTNATEKSLIILDEIGRGTSTYDGVSIAWAVSEYILNSIKAKTLFATHYHELTAIADKYPVAKNYNASVLERNDEVIFLRKIVAGSADRSYGIYVAELAGLPNSVTRRANEILSELEAEEAVDGTEKKHHSSVTKGTEVIVKQMLIFDDAHPAIDKLREININELTPMNALNVLSELKELADK